MTVDARSGVRDLTTGPVAPTLIAFALPALTSSLLQSLGGSINTIWVGRFLGEQALAATINGNMVAFLLMALAFGTGMSANILVARAVGGGDLDRARRVMGTAVGTFAAMSVAVAGIGWVATPQILQGLGTPAESAELATIYLRITFLGLPASLLFGLLMMGLRGAGDAVTPMKFTAAIVLQDVALNPVLILGIGPAPALGVAGAAWALAIANAVTLAAAVIWIYRRDIAIRLRGPELRYLRPPGRLLWEIVGKGLPMGVQMIVMTLSAMTILSLVNAEGVLTTAAYGVAQQLWGYLQMPAMAVSAAVSTLTAQAIGAGAWRRIDAVVRSGLAIGLAMTAVCVAVLLCLDGPVTRLFMKGNSPAVPITEHILWTTAWGFCAFTITSVLFGCLRAEGVVLRPLVIAVASMFGVRLAVAFVGYPWIGANALWLSLTVGQVANCLLIAGLYMGQRRRRGGRLQATALPAVAPEPITREAAGPVGT